MRSPRSPKGPLPLVELGVLLLVAALALTFQLTLPSRLPTEADYRAVAQHLAAHGRAGDAVLLFPWWTERARLFVPPALPVYGYLGSDGAPLAAHPRLWVLGQPGLPRADADGFREAFGPHRRALEGAQRFGHLELSLWENGRHRPRLFTASEALATARVHLEGPGGERRPCPLQAGRHRCPGPPHLYVATEWHELRFEPRRCLWMHPPGGAWRLVAEFDGVPGGAPVRLEGGLIWELAPQRAPHLSTTQVAVEDARGQPLLSLRLPPGLEGVQGVEGVLPGAGPQTVRVWVQADNAEGRQVCLDLFALGERPQEGA